MTENGSQGLVVCGIDGSHGSRLALQEAIRTAARRGDRIRAIAVFEPPETRAAWGYGSGSGIPLPDPDALWEDELKAARMMVDEVIGEVTEAAPDQAPPAITVEALPGHPAEVLVDVAHGADELVVGHRGRGAFGSVMLGSVGLGCVLHASCPVTVVPEPAAS